VLAALANPQRRVLRLVASEGASARLPLNAKPDIIEADQFKLLLPQGAVHQGLAAKVEPLAALTIDEACEPPDHRPVLVLDQVSDPQNVGAMFRCAAAFDVRALVQQDRHAPPVTGFLAKAAAGAIETVPDVRVVNIARSLEALTDMGYVTVGLAGESAQDLEDALEDERPVAIVIGAEGEGLRELVARTCERRARIAMSAQMESLNASAACAIALYAASRRKQRT
jgi:23S rRNA (guanosine2251-2'-O)-methyltransferase